MPASTRARGWQTIPLEGDAVRRQRPSPEHALGELSGLVDILSGRQAPSVRVPLSELDQASELCSRTLSDWSWLWRQPGHYLRLWWPRKRFQFALLGGEGLRLARGAGHQGS